MERESPKKETDPPLEDKLKRGGLNNSSIRCKDHSERHEDKGREDGDDSFDDTRSDVLIIRPVSTIRFTARSTGYRYTTSSTSRVWDRCQFDRGGSV